MSGPTEICALCWPGCKSRLFIFYVISMDCIHSFPSNMAIFHCERNRTIIFSAGLTKCGSGSRLIDLANSYNTARDCIHSHLAKWHFFSWRATANQHFTSILFLYQAPPDTYIRIAIAGQERNRHLARREWT